MLNIFFHLRWLRRFYNYFINTPFRALRRFELAINGLNEIQAQYIVYIENLYILKSQRTFDFYLESKFQQSLILIKLAKLEFEISLLLLNIFSLINETDLKEIRFYFQNLYFLLENVTRESTTFGYKGAPSRAPWTLSKLRGAKGPREKFDFVKTVNFRNSRQNELRPIEFPSAFSTLKYDLRKEFYPLISTQALPFVTKWLNTSFAFGKRAKLSIGGSSGRTNSLNSGFDRVSKGCESKIRDCPTDEALKSEGLKSSCLTIGHRLPKTTWSSSSSNILRRVRSYFFYMGEALKLEGRKGKVKPLGQKSPVESASKEIECSLLDPDGEFSIRQVSKDRVPELYSGQLTQTESGLRSGNESSIRYRSEDSQPELCSGGNRKSYFNGVVPSWSEAWARRLQICDSQLPRRSYLNLATEGRAKGRLRARKSYFNVLKDEVQVKEVKGPKVVFSSMGGLGKLLQKFGELQETTRGLSLNRVQVITEPCSDQTVTSRKAKLEGRTFFSGEATEIQRISGDSGDAKRSFASSSSDVSRGFRVSPFYGSSKRLGKVKPGPPSTKHTLSSKSAPRLNPVQFKVGRESKIRQPFVDETKTRAELGLRAGNESKIRYRSEASPPELRSGGNRRSYFNEVVLSSNNGLRGKQAFSEGPSEPVLRKKYDLRQLRSGFFLSDDSQPRRLQPVLQRPIEQIGLVPRSIIRTLDRFRKQLFSVINKLVLQEFRISRYQVFVSIRCFLSLVFIPLGVNLITKKFLFIPFIEYFWNIQQKTLFINSYQQCLALQEMQNFEDELYFNFLLKMANPLLVTSSPSALNLSFAQDLSQLRSSFPLESFQESTPFESLGLERFAMAKLPQVLSSGPTDQVSLVIQQKILKLAAEYNQESIESLTNLLGDFVTIITLFVLFRFLKPQIIILKSFLTESIYSLSDTTKSFLLILSTDLLVGFHSPRGWEIFLEFFLDRFGLSHNQNFILLFVATFPVLLDTVFKYWIFRYLNKISPSTVATYHAMIE